MLQIAAHFYDPLKKPRLCVYTSYVVFKFTKLSPDSHSRDDVEFVFFGNERSNVDLINLAEAVDAVINFETENEFEYKNFSSLRTYFIAKPWKDKPPPSQAEIDKIVADEIPF